MELVSIKNILYDFHDLIRDLNKSGSEGTHKINPLHIKNHSILKNFFICAEECFEEESRKNFKEAAENYFLKVASKQPDPVEIRISIELIDQHLDKLREKGTYLQCLNVISKYSFRKKFPSNILSALRLI